MTYLSVDRFKTLTVLPRAWVDAVDRDTPGYVLAQLEQWSDHITARLRKRYPKAFGTDGRPVPGIIEKWLNHLVTLEVDLKRGVSQTDEQFQIIKTRAETALAEIQEAANGQTGLFDLPSYDEGAESGIGAGGPRVYTEASPYAWTDAQRQIGHSQDRNRRGGDY